MRSPEQSSGQRAGAHPSPFPVQLVSCVSAKPGDAPLWTSGAKRAWRKVPPPWVQQATATPWCWAPGHPRCKGGVSQFLVGTGGHTATPGVFPKPKDGAREEREPQGTALPPADAEQSTPQQAQSPPKEMRDGVTTGFPHSCWASRKRNPFISFSVPLSVRVLTRRTNQPPFSPQVAVSGCQCWRI